MDNNFKNCIEYAAATNQVTPNEVPTIVAAVEPHCKVPTRSTRPNQINLVSWVSSIGGWNGSETPESLAAEYDKYAAQEYGV